MHSCVDKFNVAAGKGGANFNNFNNFNILLCSLIQHNLFVDLFLINALNLKSN